MAAVLLVTVFLSLPVNAATLITNVNLFDSRKARLVNDVSVLIEDNRVVAVGKTLTTPDQAEVIDGGGNTLLPGLIDTHVHLSIVGSTHAMNDLAWDYVPHQMAKRSRDMLMRGFTTVRDLGGPVFGLRKAIEEGLVDGPRIFPSGAFITQTSGHGDFRRATDAHPGWGGYPNQDHGIWRRGLGL
jgi:imidazolonepropionase-like amidohydrolase